jgi:raffinose/stachyose/melibiose transport system permease protein
MKIKKLVPGILTYTFLGIGVLIILIPLYLTIITAFKSPEMLTKNFFNLPESWYFNNFTHVFTENNYLRYLFNSIITTSFSVVSIIILVPAVSYAIARNFKSRFYKILYYFIIGGIFVPFQVILVPEIKIASAFGLMTNIGIIPIYIALAFSSNVFLAVGYIKTIPLEIDESAHIDGAGPIRTFIQIIFPIAKTIVATIAILATLWIWNDFLLPLIMLNRSSVYWTLTLFQYNFRDQFKVDYTVSAAAFITSIIPVMIIYVFLQRYIIKGLVQGSVKG